MRFRGFVRVAVCRIHCCVSDATRDAALLNKLRFSRLHFLNGCIPGNAFPEVIRDPQQRGSYRVPVRFPQGYPRLPQSTLEHT